MSYLASLWVTNILIVLMFGLLVNVECIEGKRNKEDIPSPRKDPVGCGSDDPMIYGWVCDPDSVLPDGDAEEINAAITKSRHESACPCSSSCQFSNGVGHPIGVAIINSMTTVNSDDTTKEKLKEAVKYAEYLRDDSWKLGRCGNDVIIFLAMEDRIVYTATGRLASQNLTDKCVDEIYEENKHYLTDGNATYGLKTMIDEYGKALTKTHGCNKGFDIKENVWWIVLLSIFGSIFIFGGIVCCCKGGSGTGGGGGWGSGGGGVCGGGGGGGGCGGGGGGGF